MGLSVAIDAYLQGFGKRQRIDVSAEYENMEERLSPDLELVVYRTVQEALTNVARHAHATACRVQLSRSSDRIDLWVEDNGVGFDAVAVGQPGPQRGLGLLGMQERIAQAGGAMVIESAPGNGTRVLATLPISPSEATTVTHNAPAPFAAQAPEGSHA
jgi:signal transduction histidine kinase